MQSLQTSEIVRKINEVGRWAKGHVTGTAPLFPPAYVTILKPMQEVVIQFRNSEMSINCVGNHADGTA